jgi:phosphorylase kinase alpha/beta subunit
LGRGPRLAQPKLKKLPFSRTGTALYPELYLVAEESTSRRASQPGSQRRIANTNLPLIWTQSLAWLGEMLLEQLITPADIDPCNRRTPAALGADSVLVAIAPETEAVRKALIAAGCPIDAENTIIVQPSSALKDRLKFAGNNTRLGLSGRPGHRVETEETARFYRQNGQQLVFIPTVLEDSNTYLADDTQQLLDSVVDELHLLQRHWRGSGLPLLVIPNQQRTFSTRS